MSSESAAVAAVADVPPDAPAELVEVDGKMLPVSVEDGKRVAKDGDGNKYVLAEKKPNALEMKRMMALLERRKRLINKGVDPKKVDLVIAQEDYNALPVEKKFEKHKDLMNGAVKRLAQDMTGLQHNDGVLADAMDVNFRSFAEMLVDLGMPLEKQGEIIKRVQAKIEDERKARMDAQRKVFEDRAKQAQENKEKKSAEALAKAEGKPELTSTEPTQEEAAPLPDGATTFGD